jgi:Arc/MetJ family transcription regulator
MPIVIKRLRRRELRLTPSANELITRAMKVSGLTAGQLAYECARRYLEDHERRSRRRAASPAGRKGERLPRPPFEEDRRSKPRERKTRRKQLRLPRLADNVMVEVAKLTGLSTGQLAYGGALRLLKDHERWRRTHRPSAGAREEGRATRR